MCPLSNAQIQIVSSKQCISQCRGWNLIISHFSRDLPLASEASALDLTKSLGSTQEGGNADNSDDRQNLEEVPADIVHVEYKLHGNDGAEEDTVGDGSCRKCLLEVGNIAAEDGPLLELLVHDANNVCCIVAWDLEYSRQGTKPEWWQGRPVRRPER